MLDNAPTAGSDSVKAVPDSGNASNFGASSSNSLSANQQHVKANRPASQSKVSSSNQNKSAGAAQQPSDSSDEKDRVVSITGVWSQQRFAAISLIVSTGLALVLIPVVAFAVNFFFSSKLSSFASATFSALSKYNLLAVLASLFTVLAISSVIGNIVSVFVSRHLQLNELTDAQKKAKQSNQEPILESTNKISVVVFGVVSVAASLIVSALSPNFTKSFFSSFLSHNVAVISVFGVLSLLVGLGLPSLVTFISHKLQQKSSEENAGVVNQNNQQNQQNQQSNQQNQALNERIKNLEEKVNKIASTSDGYSAQSKFNDAKKKFDAQIKKSDIVQQFSDFAKSGFWASGPLPNGSDSNGLYSGTQLKPSHYFSSVYSHKAYLEDCFNKKISFSVFHPSEKKELEFERKASLVSKIISDGLKLRSALLPPVFPFSSLCSRNGFDSFARDLCFVSGSDAVVDGSQKLVDLWTECLQKPLIFPAQAFSSLGARLSDPAKEFDQSFAEDCKHWHDLSLSLKRAYFERAHSMFQDQDRPDFLTEAYNHFYQNILAERVSAMLRACSTGKDLQKALSHLELVRDELCKISSSDLRPQIHDVSKPKAQALSLILGFHNCDELAQRKDDDAYLAQIKLRAITAIDAGIYQNILSKGSLSVQEGTVSFKDLGALDVFRDNSESLFSLVSTFNSNSEVLSSFANMAYSKLNHSNKFDSMDVLFSFLLQNLNADAIDCLLKVSNANAPETIEDNQLQALIKQCESLRSTAFSASGDTYSQDIVNDGSFSALLVFLKTFQAKKMSGDTKKELVEKLSKDELAVLERTIYHDPSDVLTDVNTNVRDKCALRQLIEKPLEELKEKIHSVEMEFDKSSSLFSSIDGHLAPECINSLGQDLCCNKKTLAQRISQICESLSIGIDKIPNVSFSIDRFADKGSNPEILSFLSRSVRIFFTNLSRDRLLELKAELESVSSIAQLDDLRQKLIDFETEMRGITNDIYRGLSDCFLSTSELYLNSLEDTLTELLPGFYNSSSSYPSLRSMIAYRALLHKRQGSSEVIFSKWHEHGIAFNKVSDVFFEFTAGKLAFEKACQQIQEISELQGFPPQLKECFNAQNKAFLANLHNISLSCSPSNNLLPILLVAKIFHIDSPGKPTQKDFLRSLDIVAKLNYLISEKSKSLDCRQLISMCPFLDFAGQDTKFVVGANPTAFVHLSIADRLEEQNIDLSEERKLVLDKLGTCPPSALLPIFLGNNSEVNVLSFMSHATTVLSKLKSLIVYIKDGNKQASIPAFVYEQALFQYYGSLSDLEKEGRITPELSSKLRSLRLDIDEKIGSPSPGNAAESFVSIAKDMYSSDISFRELLLEYLRSISSSHLLTSLESQCALTQELVSSQNVSEEQLAHFVARSQEIGVIDKVFVLSPIDNWCFRTQNSPSIALLGLHAEFHEQQAAMHNSTNYITRQRHEKLSLSSLSCAERLSALVALNSSSSIAFFEDLIPNKSPEFINKMSSSFSKMQKEHSEKAFSEVQDLIEFSDKLGVFLKECEVLHPQTQRSVPMNQLKSYVRLIGTKACELSKYMFELLAYAGNAIVDLRFGVIKHMLRSYNPRKTVGSKIPVDIFMRFSEHLSLVGNLQKDIRESYDAINVLLSGFPELHDSQSFQQMTEAFSVCFDGKSPFLDESADLSSLISSSQSELLAFHIIQKDIDALVHSCGVKKARKSFAVPPLADSAEPRRVKLQDNSQSGTAAVNDEDLLRLRTVLQSLTQEHRAELLEVCCPVGVPHDATAGQQLKTSSPVQQPCDGGGFGVLPPTAVSVSGGSQGQGVSTPYQEGEAAMSTTLASN